MHPFWWAAWLAPAPFIVATLCSPVSHRRWLTLLGGALAGISSFSYHLTVSGWFVALLIVLVVAVGWSSAIRLAVTFAERGRFAFALLAVPVVWAAIDTLLIHLSPHGSAGSIAYSQMNALPVIQVASIGGLPAITFVVLLGGSFLGFLLGRATATDIPGGVTASAAALCAISAALTFGLFRLQHPAQALGPDVALIATDAADRRQTSWAGFWQVYGDWIEQSAKPGSIVVLPEAVLDLPMTTAEAAAQMLANVASRSGSTIVVGVSVEGAREITGRALVARPDGTHYWYRKQHLIPGIEGKLTPGSDTLVIPFDEAAAGIAICKDMHFPTLGRDYAKRGSALMLVPANDFEVDDWLAARMTVLRGVESGFSIARAARGGGISFVSDRYGRVIAERRSDATMGSLIVRAPLEPADRTLYSRIGDLFGWVCVLAWAIMLAFRFGLVRKLFVRTGQ